jgi:type VI secretion-associated protein, ImpA family
MTKVETRDRRPHRRTELDAAAILAPLHDAGGVGPDLSQVDDSPFDAIREARRQDDDLPQGVWQAERKHADWDQVLALCQETLAAKSKDLRLLVWLVEALVQRDGFAALAPGFSLLEQFCRTFWVNVHPLMDDDGDLSARTNTIALLNNRLPRILHAWPITQSGFAEPVRLGWGDYETARLYQARGAAGPGGITTAAFQASAAATPVAQLEQLRQEVESGLAAVAGLDAFLDQVCAREAPSLMALKSLLVDIAGWLNATLPEAPLPEPEPFSAANVGEDDTMTPPAPAAGIRDSASGGPIANRDDAYRRLADVADYLMRVEPHSPAPYVLRRVLAWGRMPLHEVLLEMASGRNDLSAVLELITSRE